MNKKILALGFVSALALAGCSAPSAFESARISDCVRLVEDQLDSAGAIGSVVGLKVSSGSYQSQGENTGIVSGTFERTTIGTGVDGVDTGTYQCSVSGTDVVIDDVIHN